MFEKDKQRLKEYWKNYRKAKKLVQRFFIYFSLHSIKMEEKVLIFGKQCVNKMIFIKTKDQLVLIK